MQDDEAAPGAGAAVRHGRSLPMYIGAGGIATASHYAITIAAVELLGMMAVAASALGFACGAIIKYWLNYRVAFQSRARHVAAMPRYVVSLAILLALNTAIFALLQRGLGLYYIAAQALTTILLIPPGYLISRNWVFRGC